MQDSFSSRSTLQVGSRSYEIRRLRALEGKGVDLARLPFSIRILLEDLLRTEDGVNVTRRDIETVLRWNASAELPLSDERQVASR